MIASQVSNSREASRDDVDAIACVWRVRDIQGRKKKRKEKSFKIFIP